MPSSRTHGRGDPTKWLAGHQTMHAPGSRPSGTRNSCNENSNASGGARRKASDQSSLAALPSKVSPALIAAAGPFANTSIVGISKGLGSSPSVRRVTAQSRALRHCSTSKSPAPSWRPDAQSLGKSLRATLLPAACPIRRRTRCWLRPLINTSASAAHACPSRVERAGTP